MFKIEDDKDSGYRTLKFGGKVLFRWLRKKALLKRLDHLSSVVSMMAQAQNSNLQAKGIMRDIQEVQVKFLNTFSDFAKDNQITYWLDFGTLIGASRSKGFIPWDDDIDLSVPRKDYSRLQNLSDRLPEGYYFAFGNAEGLLKLKHKDLPEVIGLDLFPVDFITKSFSTEESMVLTKKIFAFQDSQKNKPRAIRKPIIDEFLHSLGVDYVDDWKQAKMLCYGTEFRHGSHPTILINNEYIFPLSSIEFEGGNYPCPNQVWAYLTLLYRDYRVANFSRAHHCDVKNFTMNEMLAIGKFLHNN